MLLIILFYCWQIVKDLRISQIQNVWYIPRSLQNDSGKIVSNYQQCTRTEIKHVLWSFGWCHVLLNSGGIFFECNTEIWFTQSVKLDSSPPLPNAPAVEEISLISLLCLFQNIKLSPEETCSESWTGNMEFVCKVSHWSTEREKKYCSDCQ